MTSSSEYQKTILEDFENATARMREMQSATSQNFEDVLKRYFYIIRPESQIGARLVEELPHVDFKEWYMRVKSTEGGMVGSAKLSWPLDTKSRLTVQYMLLLKFYDGKLNLLNFAHKFTYSGGNITDDYMAFFETVVVPFHNDILKLFKSEIEGEQQSTSIESDTTQSDQVFAEIESNVQTSVLSTVFKVQILSDLEQARLSFNGGSFKGCVVMLGATLEGVMLATLQRADVIRGLVDGTIEPPVAIARIGISDPRLADKIAEKLKFEDLRQCLNTIVVDLDQLRIDDIQDFRNAIHPWKALTEPAKFGTFDQARAIHYIGSLKKITDHLLIFSLQHATV